MIGNALADKTTLVGLLKQRQRLKGSFFGWLAEVLSTHPHLTNRITSLINWSKEYNPTIHSNYMIKQQRPELIESLLQVTEQ